MSIKIMLNGKEESLSGAISIDELLKLKKIRREVVTIELNEAILEREKYASTFLKAGDKLEFVYYMGGGQDKFKSDNILGLIGNTPITKLNKVVGEGMAEIWAKLESFNPGGSVKDRTALGMIQDAEEKGLLKPGGRIVEPTAGNTGIGLALIGAVRGYQVTLVMPETMSLERIYILKSFGAEVVLTPGIEGIKGSIKKAEEMVKKIKAYMPQQFKNPANPAIFKKTMAKEIFEALNGKIDCFVASVGTGGTLTGVGEYLRERIPGIKIVAVEPAGSPVLSGGQPGPHKIQGIGAGFIPEVLNRLLIDEVMAVSDNDAFRMSKKLAQQEGLFVGISSGAAAFGALKAAKDLGRDKVVVTVFPDTGERYFSLEQFFEG